MDAFILGVPRGTSAKMMRHGLHMLPMEHIAKLSRAKLYRKIRGTQNIDYTLHSTADNEMDGLLRHRNVADAHQDNWRNQHTYNQTTTRTIHTVQVT